MATSRYLAEDAVDEIFVDFAPLPAVVDLDKALLPDQPLVHDDLDSNLAAHVVQKKNDWEAARAKAEVVVKRRFVYDHGAATAMENRGVVAHWDPRADRLTVWDTTQAPIPIRNGLAAMLGLSEHQVRLVAPFIGGGFGPKIMMFYPEEVLIPWLAIQLGRPVKWIEDRAENFVATTQERSQIHDAELALNRDERILGVRDSFLHDTGAYDPYGLTVPLNSQCTLLPERVQGRLHQSADRHPLPRGRTPARGVRDGTAPRPSGPRTRPRRHRDPAPQLHPPPTLFPTRTRSSTRTSRL